MMTNDTSIFVAPVILVVGGPAEDLQLLTGMLAGCGYRAMLVRESSRAVEIARGEKPALVLLPAGEEAFDCFDLCKDFKNDPVLGETPVLFWGSFLRPEHKAKCFAAGGSDYIGWPCQPEEIRARLANQLRLARLQNDLAQRVQAHVTEISYPQMSTLLALTELAEIRDPETGKHIQRVQLLCKLLATRLMGYEKYSAQIDANFIERIFYASAMHDIGKVGIPDAILLKNGKLTKEEYERMKTHVLVGAQSLAKVQEKYPNNAFINMSVSICRWHHENWDGGGYPDGLNGEQIPLSARIMAVVDVYDALHSKRVYKLAFSHQQSCEMLRADRGRHFDPQVLDVFLHFDQEFERAFATL